MLLQVTRLLEPDWTGACPPPLAAHIRDKDQNYEIYSHLEYFKAQRRQKRPQSQL